MTLEEIKAAVLAGKKVCWLSSNYLVIVDSLDKWLIESVYSKHCIGLTWADNITMNGKEDDFYIVDSFEHSVGLVNDMLCSLDYDPITLDEAKKDWPILGGEDVTKLSEWVAEHILEPFKRD